MIITLSIKISFLLVYYFITFLFRGLFIKINSVKIDDNSDNKCFIINKKSFNVFDLLENKLIETFNYNETQSKI